MNQKEMNKMWIEVITKKFAENIVNKSAELQKQLDLVQTISNKAIEFAINYVFEETKDKEVKSADSPQE